MTVTVPFAAVLLTISLSDLHLKVGTDTVGLEITSGNVDLATLAPTALGDLRSWFAVKAEHLSGSLQSGTVARAQRSPRSRCS